MLELGWGLTKILTPVLYGVSLLVVLMTFYRIEIGIFFLTFFLPLQNILDYVNIYPLGKDINDLILAALLVKWILNSRARREPLLQPNPLNWPLLLFIFLTLWGTWRGSAYLHWPPPLDLGHPLLIAWKNSIIPYLMFFIVYNNIKNPKTMKALVLTMTAAILMLDRNFYNILSLQDTSHYSNTLKTAFIGGGAAISGNALAVFLAQYCIILLALFFCDTSKLRKIIYAPVSALSYYCVMFLFSRSGYLAAFVSLTLLGLLRNRRLLILMIVAMLFWNLVLPTAVVQRISMTTEGEEYDGTTRQRLGMWQQAEEMICRSPLLGHGFFITPYIEVRAGSEFDYVWGSFHNNFLQTAVEIGLLGLFLTLLLFGLGFWQGWRLFRNSDNGFNKGLGLGLCCCIGGVLAGNIAGSYWHFFTVASFFWIFIALATRLNTLSPSTDRVSPSTSRQKPMLELIKMGNPLCTIC
ncbi:O-antigen ligase family protein [candidate division KSB1 bacterium]|nr:O-antigen ligase family protein [candidate division KSB1 bacterium]